MGKGNFLINGAGTEYCILKSGLQPLSPTKIRGDFIDINIKAITLKLCKENIFVTLGLAKVFRLDTESNQQKRKNDKLDFLKIKNFCYKDTIKKITRQATD